MKKKRADPCQPAPQIHRIYEPDAAFLFLMLKFSIADVGPNMHVRRSHSTVVPDGRCWSACSGLLCSRGRRCRSVGPIRYGARLHSIWPNYLPWYLRARRDFHLSHAAIRAHRCSSALGEGDASQQSE